MQIQHQDNHQEGEFFLNDNQGNKIASLTYLYVSPQTINANHTYVDESLRGQGIADKLYQALRDFVLAKELRLLASCNYIERKWQREKLR